MTSSKKKKKSSGLVALHGEMLPFCDLVFCSINAATRRLRRLVPFLSHS